MTILYVFPHPDDESFGPGPAIARQIREGHAVHLLTLTKGGATKQRERLGLSIEEMGDVREREMRCVAEVYGLASLSVLDLPDGKLKDLDPRIIEVTVAEHIRRVRPAVVVTYAVHGVSGFFDHLVTHAVVKRVFCELRAQGADYLRRLALFTLIEGEIEEAPVTLRGLPRTEIGALVQGAAEDFERAREALACYETYQQVIAEHDPLRQVTDGVAFRLFSEPREHPLDDLTGGL
jgi:LmbE family N-acetylglucosaminyl deacetylase